VPDCLLRQLRQDHGDPIEVGVEGPSFAHHVLQGDTLYSWPPSVTIIPDPPSASHKRRSRETRFFGLISNQTVIKYERDRLRFLLLTISPSGERGSTDIIYRRLLTDDM